MIETAFDEIRKIAFRALDGAGAPPGLDEDAGWACAWLEAAGYPGLAMLADLLDEAEKDELRAGLEMTSNGEMDAAGRSAICLAPLIVEFAAAQAHTVTVRNLRHSPYLVAHAARLATDGVWLRVHPDREDVCDVSIERGGDGYEAERETVAAAIEHGLKADGQAFDRVYRCSRAILVPPTEASLLTGAGAGLTDND